MEKWLLDKLFEAFPHLTKDDMRVPIGAEGGEDIKLSTKASVRFPFSIECKNQESFSNIYKFYRQAKHIPNLEPLLFIKMNNEKPLAIIDAEYFINIIKG